MARSFIFQLCYLRKAAFSGRNLSNDILVGWWDVSELWSISSQNECKVTLQKAPSLFLVPQLCQCWFSLSPRSQKGPGRNCRPCLHWISCCHRVFHDQSTPAAQPQALLDYTGHWHFTESFWIWAICHVPLTSTKPNSTRRLWKPKS